MMNLDALLDLIASSEAFRAALSVDPVAALKSVGVDASAHVAEQIARAVASVADFHARAAC